MTESRGNSCTAPVADSVKRRLIPLTKWPEYYPWPTVPALRQLVFHADSNGFSAVIRRVGRRILIDEAEFFKWIDTMNRRDAA